jgi:hypothetical protein
LTRPQHTEPDGHVHAFAFSHGNSCPAPPIIISSFFPHARLSRFQGFDLASPQLTPQLTHMGTPSDYLRRVHLHLHLHLSRPSPPTAAAASLCLQDSIESLVGLGAPLSGACPRAARVVQQGRAGSLTSPHRRRGAGLRRDSTDGHRRDSLEGLCPALNQHLAIQFIPMTQV